MMMMMMMMKVVVVIDHINNRFKQKLCILIRSVFYVVYDFLYVTRQYENDKFRPKRFL
jgi:hypothetical protein